MPKVVNRSDDRLLRSIKDDIVENADISEERSYQVLDDGTLVVHLWSQTQLSPIRTYRLNISIGREMKPSEWKTNGETPNEG